MSGGEELAGGTRVDFHFAGDSVEWKKGSTAWRNVSKGYTGISFLFHLCVGRLHLRPRQLISLFVCHLNRDMRTCVEMSPQRLFWFSAGINANKQIGYQNVGLQRIDTIFFPGHCW